MAESILGSGARPRRADMAVLDIRSVSKAFGAVRAVDTFDLTVGDGELVCLLGPSGSGKSTLLRMIGGFETPDLRHASPSTART